MKKTIVSLVLVISMIAGCSTQQLVVDPKSISDQTKFDQDKQECKTVSETYDKTESVAGNAALGAAAGGATAAGVATAVAGAIFWPAIPFIIAGGLVVGAASGGSTKSDEITIREKIWVDCLNDRGYKAYSTR